MSRVLQILRALRRIATTARPDAFAFDVVGAAWGATTRGCEALQERGY